MQIWIYPADGTVAIDDMHVQGIDCSSVPTNVSLVMWYGNDINGKPKGGEVLYNDRWSIREPFMDPTPYLGPMNSLLSSAAGTYTPVQVSTPAGFVTPKTILRQQATVTIPPNMANPGLTVLQAQTVKQGLLDGLFQSKNTANVTVGGQTYTASHDDVSAMAAQLAAVSQQVIDALHAEIGAAANSTASSVISNVNTATAGYATNFANEMGTGLGAGYTKYADALNRNWEATAGSNFAGIVDLTWTPPVFPSATTPTITPTEAMGPAMTWPNSSGQSQNLTFAQMSALLKAITDRRTTLQTTHLSKRAAISALGSVAAVANYDVTQGW